MRTPKKTSSMRRLSIFPLAATSALAGACNDVPVDDTTFPPQGNLRGHVVYTGPLPCTQSVAKTDENGNVIEWQTHVVGAAALLVFNENLLPPPEGFGTSAAQLGVVEGDVLFQSITSSLPTPAPGQISCHAPGGPTVTVSAPFTIGPVPAGRFQIRGFYDYDGDFSPLLKIHQLPTAGDVGGGAIANVSDVLAGKPVIFQTLSVGVDYGDGQLQMPQTGALVDNITVQLAQVLPFGRPIFNVADVADVRPGHCPMQQPDPMDPTKTVTISIPCTAGPAPNTQTDPNAVTMTQDERLEINPANATNLVATPEEQFIRLKMGAGVRPEEQQLAVGSPYFLQVVPPYDKLYLYAHTDRNGQVLSIPETPLVADLFPWAVLGKLDERDASHQTAQASPAVISLGIVLNETLTKTLKGTVPKVPMPVDSVTVALRPSVICLDPLDLEKTVYVVTPSFTALQTGETIVDPVALAAAVAQQLGNRPNIAVVEGCLPRGIFQANLVYPTGQAWTIPNEAGACLKQESASGDGCNQSVGDPNNPRHRTLLGSQETVVRIEGEREPGFCDKITGSAMHPELTYVHGVPSVCLRADELGH